MNIKDKDVNMIPASRSKGNDLRIVIKIDLPNKEVITYDN